MEKIVKLVFDNEAEEKRFRSMLSLCRRAGKLVSGETGCESAVKSQKAGVVFLSNNASKNTMKKFLNKSEYYNIPVYIIDFSTEQLGGIIGEAKRSVITIMGGDFTEQLTKLGSKHLI